MSKYEGHTPGPWTRNGAEVYQAGVLGPRKVIAVVQRHHRTTLEFERTGDLIADAPDLLAAAEEMAAALKQQQLIVGFLKSVVLSGEPWTDVCQERYDNFCVVNDAALATYRKLMEN